MDRVTNKDITNTTWVPVIIYFLLKKNLIVEKSRFFLFFLWHSQYAPIEAAYSMITVPFLKKKWMLLQTTLNACYNDLEILLIWGSFL